MVCLPSDFKILLTVFNQSYNCQTSHCLGRNLLPNSFLLLPSLVSSDVPFLIYNTFSVGLKSSAVCNLAVRTLFNYIYYRQKHGVVVPTTDLFALYRSALIDWIFMALIMGKSGPP